ncbi:MAG: flagellar biosynthetic protein FliQ, partial [Myxococcales bacterium]|nr:flagellar biosynthetic protein FliQ [Myxococcales bacterium]
MAGISWSRVWLAASWEPDMEPSSLSEIVRNALWTAMQLGAPVLAISLVVGVAVSTFQAATQINEMT